MHLNKSTSPRSPAGASWSASVAENARLSNDHYSLNPKPTMQACAAAAGPSPPPLRWNQLFSSRATPWSVPTAHRTCRSSSLSSECSAVHRQHRLVWFSWVFEHSLVGWLMSGLAVGRLLWRPSYLSDQCTGAKGWAATGLVHMWHATAPSYTPSPCH